MEDILYKYAYALEILQSDMNIILDQFVKKNNYNPIEHVKCRLKSLESIKNKLEDKNYELTIENVADHIHDIVGMRIICSFLPDVYNVVKAIKKSNVFRIKEEKDYIESPKKSGYRSYHLIVYVPVFINGVKEEVEAEIQIRTMAMDFWASLDHKIQYKFKKGTPNEIKAEMFNCSLDIQNLDCKMDHLNEIMSKYNDN